MRIRYLVTTGETQQTLKQQLEESKVVLALAIAHVGQQHANIQLLQSPIENKGGNSFDMIDTESSLEQDES